MLRVAVGLLASILVCSCSSGYEPARSPRIAIVVEGGSPAFVKDGTRSGSTLFGGGLVDAVRGNPRAEEQARIARNLTIGGFVLDLAGFGSEVGGVVALAHEPGSNGHSSALGAGLLLGGLGAVLAGTIMLISAPPHVYDAVNIYNDGVDSARH